MNTSNHALKRSWQCLATCCLTVLTVPSIGSAQTPDRQTPDRQTPDRQTGELATRSEPASFRSEGSEMPPLRGSSEQGYSVGLAAFAEDVVRGLANVTIVGDSINNDGQSGFMMSGYLLEWRPVRWRQFHPPVNTSGASIGSWLEFSSSAHYDYLRPGQTTSTTERFKSTYPRSIRVISGEGWTGRAMSSGFNAGGFSFEGGQLREAGLPHRFLSNPGPYRHRFLVVTDGGASSRNTWTIRSRNSAAGTSWTDSLDDIEFDANADARLEWFDHVIPGSSECEGHQGSGLYLSGAPLQAQEQLGMAGVVITDIGTDVGLGLAYVGEGGWRTENHAFPTGSEDLPVIASSAGPYVGSYTDEALLRHMEAHETTHVMVWIGTNNGGADFHHPERAAEDVMAIIKRYENVHDIIRQRDDRIDPLKFLVVAPYTGGHHDYFDRYAQELKEAIDGNVAFLDLNAMVKDRFGEYVEWSSTFLADGVHPNLEGARTFAAMIWRKMVESIGPTADLDRNGQVDGQDFGLLLFDWDQSGHPGPADITGDGRVDGADLGELFLQWGDTAD